MVCVYHDCEESGVDMGSTTAIVRLDVGDYFYADLWYSPVYSDVNYQTSMMGFLYSPSALPAVAWSATQIISS